VRDGRRRSNIDGRQLVGLPMDLPRCFFFSCPCRPRARWSLRRRVCVDQLSRLLLLLPLQSLPPEQTPKVKRGIAGGTRQTDERMASGSHRGGAGLPRSQVHHSRRTACNGWQPPRHLAVQPRCRCLVSGIDATGLRTADVDGCPPRSISDQSY
jgi:hypothetical protein